MDLHIIIIISVCTGGGGRRGGDEEDLANENKYNKELLDLLRQEGGENTVFESYCSAFEDQYGDRYDWEGDTATQHFLCRFLYAHYKHLVSSSACHGNSLFRMSFLCTINFDERTVL